MPCEHCAMTLAIDAITSLQGSIESLKAQTRQIPTLVDEYTSSPQGSSVTSINVTPQSRNVEKVTHIIAYSSASKAVVTIGRRTFKIPQDTITSIPTGQMIVYPNDTRNLTATSGGQLHLELMGEELGDLGSF